MSVNRIRHLPVVDNDKLVGIISVDDVLKAVIREQSEALEVLEAYVKDEEGGSG
ncbi:MAG: CBS domain-containing protein [Gammaproteobacteria bacterium]|nr:CBS domain-containing protein [Gammaproteobacteria bacterium]